MEVLSFGEQVKIILSRKGMTIKELAEKIQERTGKPMSRQNLTQRLGRDNFQEQDMRLIAAILECPFYLSIFPAEKAEDADEIPTEETILKYADKAQSHKKHAQADTVKAESEEPVFVAETEAEATVITGNPLASETAVTTEETFAPEAAEEPEEESGIAAEDMGLSDEEKTDVARAMEIIDEESEPAEDNLTIEEVYETYQEPEEIEESKPERKDIFHTGAIFLRKLGRQDKKEKAEKTETRPFAKVTEEDIEREEGGQENPTQDNAEAADRPVREPIAPGAVNFEPVLRYEDAAEDLEKGELNPYTGHEYQSNSVRMHPTRIGYVQVYDREKHGWLDMTEWAFLGHQEQLKAKLGRNYREPIYLD